MENDFKPDFMKQALCMAEKAASEDEVPVGAVVISRGVVIGRGYNRRETDQNPVAHAEMMALQEAARTMGTWRLIDCILVVTLEPCPMCLAASQQARIGGLVFGAKDPKGGAISLGYCLHEDIRTHHRFPVSFSEMPECGQILTNFFERKRKL